MDRSEDGYKGRVVHVGLRINGVTGITLPSPIVDELEDGQMGDRYKSYARTRIEGGEVTITGNYLGDQDEGQQALKTAFDNDSELTDVKFYTDYASGKYLVPDPNLEQFPSFVTVTKYNEISYDKDSLITFTATYRVHGRLVEASTTAEPGVETIGALDEAATTATLIGKLVGLGDEESCDCYFEYGLSSSYGSDTSVDATTLTEADVFDNDVAELVASTTYHYRAVAELADTSKKVGADKTFTTLSG